MQRRDAERRVAVAWEVGRSRAAAPTVESERKIEKRIRPSMGVDVYGWMDGCMCVQMYVQCVPTDNR